MSGKDNVKKEEDAGGENVTAAIDQVVMNLPIPALQPEERIEDWKPLFKAGVSTLLARGQEGEALAVGLLPAYINRRTAERELVREILSDCSTLDSAFAVLISTLDPPVDKYQHLQEMCRLDWVPGVQVDDFFFQLKRLGVKAGADFKFVCSLFVSQLPKEVQSKAKSWLADCANLDNSSLRTFVREVKSWLVERGVPLDRGSRQFLGAVGRPETDQAVPDVSGHAHDTSVTRVCCAK